MPEDIRLIGLDLDNTLLNPQKELTPRVRAAVTRAVEAGIIVLPATGRTLADVPAEVLSLSGIRYAITSNGAAVYDLEADGKVLFSHCFTGSDALKILRVCDTLDALTAVFIEGRAFSGPFNPQDFAGLYNAETLNYLQKSRRQTHDLYGLVQSAESPVEKIGLMFHSAGARRRAIEALAAHADICTVTSSLPGNLEVNAKDACKGTALLELGRLLGIARSQIMAVGDDTNDLTMIEAAGYGVAMANGAPELLAAADAVTASAERDGAALAIESVLPPDR